MAPIGFLSAVFPPAPPFTDANLPSLSGKVYIVTGAASGVGYETAKILYLAGGTVYIAARSTARCQDAIDQILTETKAAQGKGAKGKGRLESMIIDLADLNTVNPAAEAFLKAETRLDVLVHNAAVMAPPVGSKDKLGHDLEVGVNCLAPYLLTLLLEPILIRTAAISPSESVRIVWVVSLIQLSTPKGGMNFDANGTPVVLEKLMENYFQSKSGSTWLAAEFAQRLGDKGILSVSLHPGLMYSPLQRHLIYPLRLAMRLFFKGPVYGAYSELYAGFSSEVTLAHNGGHLMAWGRLADTPDDLIMGMKSKAEGGSGAAAKFLEYCDREIKTFL